MRHTEPRPAPSARAATLLFLAVCALGLAFNGWTAWHSATALNADFAQFYAAGRLSGTGKLFDYAAQADLQRQFNGSALPQNRLPAYAAAWRPLAALPYPTARLIWLALSVLAFTAFLWICPFGDRRTAAMVLCWSQPAALSLGLGQDPGLLLLMGAAAVWAQAAGRDRLAGAVWALWCIKPHLGAGIPIWLAARRRWGAFASATALCLAVLLACFLIEGWDWPVRLLASIRSPVSDLAPERMPNFRGILSWFPFPRTLELIASLGLLAALWRLLPADPARGGAMIMAAGLLTGSHGYVYDCVLLIPAMLLLSRPSWPAWARLWSLLLASPLPYLLVLMPRPWIGQLLIVGFALTAILLLSRQDSAPPPDCGANGLQPADGLSYAGR